jgi:hypothetical protein|tara:strand:- start:804 stop:1094 length:291 start_codon:yes stop_codon:yes gene_type:complete
MNKYKKIIDNAIGEINKQLPKQNNIMHDIDFEILGPNSNFDSMALINFILLVEQKIKSENKGSLDLLNSIMERTDDKKSYKLSDFLDDIDKKMKIK